MERIDQSLDELLLDAEELRNLLLSAKRKRVINLLEREQKSVDEQIQRTSLPVENSQQPAAPVSKPIYRTKIGLYSYGESGKFLNIYVSDKLKDLKNIPPENITSHFTERSLHLEIKDNHDRVYYLDINNLAYDIVPEASNHKLKSDSVVLNLKKKKEGQDWDCVTALEKAAKDKKKEKQEKDLKGDPGAGLMGLMKQMYEDGDDEMKRMISKNWYESQQKQAKGGLGGLDSNLDL